MVDFFPCADIASKYFAYVHDEISKTETKPFVRLFSATNDKGEQSYARIMINKFEALGIFPSLLRINSPGDLERELIKLNEDNEVTGGFVFYPINFPGFKDNYFMQRVPEFKDIEGLSAQNVYRLAHYERTFDGTPCKAVVPCTPKAIIKVLVDSNVEIKGRDVMIINKSYSLGAPLRRMFDNLGATVTACDINTNPASIRHYLKNADIVITAVPSRIEIFDESAIKEGASVIDCSFEGNFDSAKISKVAGKISSRGTGNYIGPVTTSMAALNTLYLLQHQIYTARAKL